MAWGWVHFQEIYIFGWTVPLNCFGQHVIKLRILQSNSIWSKVRILICIICICKFWVLLRGLEGNSIFLGLRRACESARRDRKHSINMFCSRRTGNRCMWQQLSFTYPGQQSLTFGHVVDELEGAWVAVDSAVHVSVQVQKSHPLLLTAVRCFHLWAVVNPWDRGKQKWLCAIDLNSLCHSLISSEILLVVHFIVPHDTHSAFNKSHCYLGNLTIGWIKKACFQILSSVNLIQEICISLTMSSDLQLADTVQKLLVEMRRKNLSWNQQTQALTKYIWKVAK